MFHTGYQRFFMDTHETFPLPVESLFQFPRQEIKVAHRWNSSFTYMKQKFLQLDTAVSSIWNCTCICVRSVNRLFRVRELYRPESMAYSSCNPNPGKKFLFVPFVWKNNIFADAILISQPYESKTYPRTLLLHFAADHPFSAGRYVVCLSQPDAESWSGTEFKF